MVTDEGEVTSPRRRKRKVDTREPNWSAWNNWCDSRMDARRNFDCAVLRRIGRRTKGHDRRSGQETESTGRKYIRDLETKMAELRAANDHRSAEEHRPASKPAEHQIAIAEPRRLANVEAARIIDLPGALQRRGLN
jgi:hypothetical protein